MKTDHDVVEEAAQDEAATEPVVLDVNDQRAAEPAVETAAPVIDEQWLREYDEWMAKWVARKCLRRAA